MPSLQLDYPIPIIQAAHLSPILSHLLSPINQFGAQPSGQAGGTAPNSTRRRRRAAGVHPAGHAGAGSGDKAGGGDGAVQGAWKQSGVTEGVVTKALPASVHWFIPSAS